MAKLEILSVRKPAPTPTPTPADPKPEAKVKEKGGKEKAKADTTPTPEPTPATEAKAKTKTKPKGGQKGKWKPKTKPTHKEPLTLDDGTPMFQGVGAIDGVLDVPGHAILGTDGHTYPVSGIRDQRLLWWLLEHAEEWRSLPCHWIVWPNFSNYTLIGAGSPKSLPTWTFTIQGSLCTPKPDQPPGTFSIWVGRNTGEVGWNIHTIHGSIPDPRDRSLYRCNCTMNKGSLTLVEAKLLTPKTATETAPNSVDKTLSQQSTQPRDP